MRSLADKIEKYLKTLIDKSEDGVIEIQRSEIAETFSCVPSQVNYVLKTRFNEGYGFFVETKRGGGGYIRITKEPLVGDYDKLLKLIDESADKFVSENLGESLIDRLYEEGFVTKREMMLIKAVICRNTLALGLPERDLLRAKILRSILLTLLKKEFNGGS